MKPIEIAKVCHEANRVLCQTLGDNSQRPWEDAAEWQRAISLDVVSYHLANPDAKANHSHEAWMKGKIANGWKFGPVKDESKKEHPCIVPFEQLPAEQKAKDSLFVAVVNALRVLV